MTEHVGVVRDRAGLQTALRQIAGLEAENPGTRTFLNMTATATLIAAAALLREESRGAHYRSDFPNLYSDRGRRSSLTLYAAMAVRDTIAKEPA